MEHVVGKAARGKAQREIEATKCEACGKEGGKLHRHHDDLRKPLDVRILCPKCHATAHKDNEGTQPMSKPRKKSTALSAGFLMSAGNAFESTGNGLYAKDILREGTYIHPDTGEIIELTPERIKRIAGFTQQWLRNGNEIGFPNGHNTDAEKNMGDWPGPFFQYGDTLMGVCKPKKASAIEGVADGSMNRVSAYIDVNVTDPLGNKYPEVITHVCATPVPVIPGQEDFIQLSKAGFKAGGLPIYLSRELMGQCDFQETAGSVDAVILALSKGAHVCNERSVIKALKRIVGS